MCDQKTDVNLRFIISPLSNIEKTNHPFFGVIHQWMMKLELCDESIFSEGKSVIVRLSRIFTSKQVRFIILNRYANEQSFLAKFFIKFR